ncbi:MAG: hypothetical protein E4H25_05455 [Methanomassiliicoccus sp.]|nr:MAG: hypothetical protein E4H25_05455 [Methanomassiliicoccus sp.]
MDPAYEGQVRVLLIVTGAKSTTLIGKNHNSVASDQSNGRSSSAPSRSYGSDDDSGIDFVR